MFSTSSHCEGSIIRAHAWYRQELCSLGTLLFRSQGKHLGEAGQRKPQSHLRRRRASGGHKATWEKKGLGRQRAGWKSLLPASFPRALPEAVLAVRRGLLLPFTGAWPRGNDVPSQTSVSSSAREGQEWSQSQRPVRGSVRAAALDPWAPRRRRPHLGACQGCRFPVHRGPLAATPRRARRQRFKEPSRRFLTPARVSEPPCLEAGLLFSRRQSSFVNISLEV